MRRRTKSVMHKGVRAFRSLAGEDSRLEAKLRRVYKRRRNRKLHREQGPGWVQQSGRKFTLVQSKSGDEPRRGILLKGGCDLPSVFLTAPLFRDELQGSVAIFKMGIGGADARSDVLLQTLEDYPEEVIADVVEQFKLGWDYFRPRLFEPDFEIDDFSELGRYPTKVVVLSIASDLVRTAYRHREHGFLVDPGGWWLNQSMDKVLSDLSAAKWFQKNFEKVGKMSLEEFRDNFERLIRVIRERSEAHVIVYNSLFVEPGDPTHNYQLVQSPHSMRRREFGLALMDMSHKLDFPIVDVDRILKMSGVREQVDFAHFPVEGMRPIAAEAHRLLRDLDVV